MFSQACEAAMQFTRPVVTSLRFLNGTVQSGPATYVVVNRDGWFITAAHIIEPSSVADQHKQKVNQYRQQVGSISANPTLGEREKRKKIAKVPKNDAWITNYSFWWGIDGMTADALVYPGPDLAIGQLKPFDPSWIGQYPKFKNPAKLPIGTSLCRLGFPFCESQCEFDEATNNFKVSPQLAFFPIEGMFTRTVIIDLNHEENGKVVKTETVKFIETTSPGLRGHSGGPVFDRNGVVWGIQSRTTHFQLGFNPEVKTGNKTESFQQFLNAGWAVHPEVILTLLTQNGVKFEVAD